ncbi:MAG: hypothetical protein J2P45_17080, partial [Candidatus Dormibacteraeota bacterium]|nr:hypothetical protein [Candidatus Dormibacteraeota bacterium]
RIPPEVKSEIDSRMEALKEATKTGGDLSGLRRAMDEFNESLQKVGQHIYQEAGSTNSGGGQQGGPSGGEDKPQDDVVDADYREV